MSEKKGIKPVDPETFFPDRFAGKVLLITGAAFGSIGGCTAIRAAREGAKVICVDIKESELNHTVDQINKIGGEATAHVADIRKPEQCIKLPETK